MRKARWIYLQLEFDFDTGGVIMPPPEPPSFKNDNEKIKAMEANYFLDRTKNINIKMLFESIKSCAKRFVRYEAQKRKLPYVDYNEKAIMATEYIIEQYIKRPDFMLRIPSAYIRLRVLAALFRHKKIDEITRFTDKDF